MKKWNQYGRDAVVQKAVELLHKGFFEVQRLTLSHKKFDGSWSRDIQREIKLRGNAACLLPYDPIRDEVVLIEQFRVGAWKASPEHVPSPWLLELIAGINDKGEDDQSLIRREAQEEAGLDVGDMSLICRMLPSSGGSNELISIYFAKVSTDGVGGVYGLPGEDEDIKVHVVSRADALQWLAEGRIINASAIIALQWLEMNLDQVHPA